MTCRTIETKDYERQNFEKRAKEREGKKEWKKWREIGSMDKRKGEKKEKQIAPLTLHGES